MTTSVVYIDMDGVLADWHSAICRFHDRPSPWLNSQWHGRAKCMEEAWGMTEDEFWGPVNNEFWMRIRKCEGADDIVASALHIVPNYEHIHILSSHGGLRRCCDGKMDWLELYYPEIYALNNYHFSVKKQRFADGFALLIDDQDDNVDAFRRAGGEAVLVPRLWNSDHALAEDSLTVTLERLKEYHV